MGESLLIAIVVSAACVAGATIIAAALMLGTGSVSTLDRWLQQRAELQAVKLKISAEIEKAKALHRERCPRIDDTSKKGE